MKKQRNCQRILRTAELSIIYEDQSSNTLLLLLVCPFCLTRIWFDMSKFSRLFRQLNTFDRSRKFSFFPKMTRACPKLSRLDSLTLAFCRRKLCSSRVAISEDWPTQPQPLITHTLNFPMLLQFFFELYCHFCGKSSKLPTFVVVAMLAENAAPYMRWM